MRGVWGGGLREDVAEAPLLLQQTEHLRIARLFGHVEWRATDRLLVNLGAMVENNNLTGTDVAPQASLNLHVAHDHVIRIGASKALRNPTLFEEKVQSIVIGPGGIPIVVSGGLQPETIVSTEAGYIGEWPAWHATLDLKLFYEKLSNLIDPIGSGSGFPPSPLPRTVVNGDDVRQRGIEGQFVWRPLPGTSLSISGAHLEADSAESLRQLLDVGAAQHVPRAGNVPVQRQLGRQPHLSPAKRLPAPRGEADVSGFQRVDLRVARRVLVRLGQRRDRRRRREPVRPAIHGVSSRERRSEAGLADLPAPDVAKALREPTPLTRLLRPPDRPPVLRCCAAIGLSGRRRKHRAEVLVVLSEDTTELSAGRRGCAPGSSRRATAACASTS